MALADHRLTANAPTASTECFGMSGHCVGYVLVLSSFRMLLACLIAGVRHTGGGVLHMVMWLQHVQEKLCPNSRHSVLTVTSIPYPVPPTSASSASNFTRAAEAAWCV
jgi:hypothetical protein